jgi:hypothetical protein
VPVLAGYNDIGGLQALGTLLDRELDLLAFFQIAIAIALDSGIVNEDVRTILASDETITLAAVEPLNGSDGAFRHCETPSFKNKTHQMFYYRLARRWRQTNKKRLKESRRLVLPSQSELTGP